MKTGHLLLAGALHQGRYAGRLIQRRIGGKPKLPPFRYFDKGNMAAVGKGFAVLASSPGWHRPRCISNSWSASSCSGCGRI